MRLMTRTFAGMSVAAAALLSSCAFLLDFDELQEGTADSGAQGGTSGTGGEGGTAGTGGPSGISLAEAPAVVADVVCQKLEDCVGPETLGLFIHDEDCRVLLERVFRNGMIANIAQSLEESAISYNPMALPACAAAYRELACEEVSLSFPEECKQALSGLQGAQQPCAHSLECAEGLFCQIGETCPGTCVPFLPVDASCTDADTCAPGLTCFQNSCRALGGENAACKGGTEPDCLTGFLCVGDNEATMQPGKCVPAKTLFPLLEDQLCSFAERPALCQQGYSCPLAFNAKCVAEAPSGGACQAAVPDMCPVGEYCVQTTCTRLPGAGENCAFSLLTAPCQAYLRCVDGICRPLGNNGNTCVQPEECYSGLCSDATCVPPRCQ